MLKAPLTILLPLLMFNLPGETLTDIGSLTDAIYRNPRVGAPFCVTATATTSRKGSATFFTIANGTNTANLVYEPDSGEATSVMPGDRVRASGSVKIGKTSRFHYASCTNVIILSRGAAPRPVDVPLRDMLAGRHDNQLVRIRGFVRDVFLDEIDSDYYYLTLSRNGEIAYVTFRRADFRLDALRSYIWSEISVPGACYPLELNARRQIGRIFHATKDHPIEVFSSASQSPFDVETLTDHPELRPVEIARLGRRKASGRVIAVWGETNLLVEDTAQRVIGVSLIEGKRPKCGESVDVAGFPASDLYRVNLTHAIWRPSAIRLKGHDDIIDIDVDAFLSDSHGEARYRPDYHGRCIRLTGTVLNIPQDWERDRRFHVKSGRHVVPVDFTACPKALKGLEVGCRVAATGTCIMESENWQPSSAFPRIRGFVIALRTPADLRVIARPSWLTPGVLVTLVGILVLVTIGILVWNRALQVVAERRGKEQLLERLGHVTSESKKQERTRLAVELHDSIAQSLTGAAMEIEAASALKGNAPKAMLSHIDIAAKTIASCRAELRNCLWDLRSQALEDRSMLTAIIKTLQPHVNASRLSVRFDVPRSRLTDNTAHAILRIVRELVLNAIRHGKATSIRIAGCIDGDRLKFSVRDNGRGFDPSSSPGVLQGHFGLQGVRERVRQLGGRISIDSKMEGGTKVSVFAKIHPPEVNPSGRDSPP